MGVSGRRPQKPDIYKQFAAVKCFSIRRFVAESVLHPCPPPYEKNSWDLTNPMTQHGRGRVGHVPTRAPPVATLLVVNHSLLTKKGTIDPGVRATVVTAG